jgi:hypothetical protein
LPEVRYVERQLVVLHDASILLLVSCDDREVRFKDEFAAVDGLPVAAVALAFSLNNVFGNAQANGAVDAALVAVVVFAIVILAYQFIAEEPCRMGAGMCDERFLRGKGQLEVLVEKIADRTFDCLSFLPWAGKTKYIPVGDGACRRFPGSAGPASAGPNPACTVSIHRALPPASQQRPAAHRVLAFRA